MGSEPEALAFRNELDSLSAKFVADYKRRDARACAETCTEDGILLLSKTPPIRGRIEIAAAFQSAMDSGLEIYGLTTTHSESDGRIGYAIQTVHSNQPDSIVMLALRCEDDGLWRVSCEAVPGE